MLPSASANRLNYQPPEAYSGLDCHACIHRTLSRRCSLPRAGGALAAPVIYRALSAGTSFPRPPPPLNDLAFGTRPRNPSAPPVTCKPPGQKHQADLSADAAQTGAKLCALQSCMSVQAQPNLPCVPSSRQCSATGGRVPTLTSCLSSPYLTSGKPHSTPILLHRVYIVGGHYAGKYRYQRLSLIT